MGASERRAEVLRILVARRSETAPNLALELGVSVSTIRRDILTLMFRSRVVGNGAHSFCRGCGAMAPRGQGPVQCEPAIPYPGESGGSDVRPPADGAALHTTGAFVESGVSDFSGRMRAVSWFRRSWCGCAPRSLKGLKSSRPPSGSSTCPPTVSIRCSAPKPTPSTASTSMMPSQCINFIIALR